MECCEYGAWSLESKIMKIVTIVIYSCGVLYCGGHGHYEVHKLIGKANFRLIWYKH
jgi:hypothetical protein